MHEQLSLLIDDDPIDEASVEEMFQPNGRDRCQHCGRPLAWFGGRLLCINAYCPQVA